MTLFEKHQKDLTELRSKHRLEEQELKTKEPSA